MTDPQTIALPPLRMADGGTFAGTLTLTGVVTPPPTPTPTPTPMPDPTPVPVPIPVPPKGQRRGLWHQGWSGAPLATLPAAVRARLTTVFLGICQSAHAGTGQLAEPPGVTPQEVRSLVADGIDVFAGIGGGGDGGISIVTDQQIGEAVASILAMQAKYGITGVCWDLEGDPGSGWTAQSIIAASRTLITHGLRISIWSGLWGGRLEGWGAVAKALGADLDSWQRGFYDFPEAKDNRLTDIVTGSLGYAAMRPYLTRDDQFVASFMPLTVADANTSPLPVILAAYGAVKAAHPTAGFSVFDDAIDGHDYAFGISLALDRI